MGGRRCSTATTVVFNGWQSMSWNFRKVQRSRRPDTKCRRGPVNKPPSPNNRVRRRRNLLVLATKRSKLGRRRQKELVLATKRSKLGRRRQKELVLATKRSKLGRRRQNELVLATKRSKLGRRRQNELVAWGSRRGEKYQITSILPRRRRRRCTSQTTLLNSSTTRRADCKAYRVEVNVSQIILESL
jgi:hypothetical protein